MIRVYLASGWFTPNTEASISVLEERLRRHPYIKPYFPRHDGVKLSANEFHDHELRKKVFNENIHQIKSSDYLLVNLDGADGFYDTGTCWELGYAMAQGIPVIVYDPTGRIHEDFKGIKIGFSIFCDSLESVDNALNVITADYIRRKNSTGKLLFVGPDKTKEQKEMNSDILATVILESHGQNFREVSTSHTGLYENIENIFEGVDYMIAVIDDRHPIVSWMMGQAQERKIPIISYTNYDYGVNIMLSCGVLTHCKGKDELRAVIQKIKREGFLGFQEYDTSKLKAY